MRSLPALVTAGWMAAASLMTAAEPTRELDDEIINRLINLRSDQRTPRLQVGFVVEGTAQNGPFEVRHVRRVFTIHPIDENGRQVRRLQVYDFHWTEAQGWFLWEKREERGGDAIWIWSELNGETIIR